MAKGMLVVMFDNEGQMRIGDIIGKNSRVKVLDHCDIRNAKDEHTGWLF